MRARVKQSNPNDTIRSAGFVFVKSEWRDVPAWAEREIGANGNLEIETALSRVNADVPPSDDAQPATAEDRATRLIIDNPGKRGKARKL